MTTTLIIDGSSVPGEATPARPRSIPVRQTVSGARLTFRGLLRSEHIKLSSLRSVRMTLLATLIAGLGLSTLIALVWNAESPGGIAAADAEELNTYLLMTGTTSAPFLALIFGVLGVLVMSSEYASGLIQSTLVAAPKRFPVFVAKGSVLALVSAVMAFVTVGGGMAIATLIAPSAAAQLWTPQIISAVLGSVAYLTLLALFAFGVATLTRNAAAGIGIVAGVTFVVPIAFSVMSMAGWAWVLTAVDYVPTSLGNTLAQGITAGNGTDLGYWGALGAIAIWAFVAVIPAAIAFVRRDAR